MNTTSIWGRPCQGAERFICRKSTRLRTSGFTAHSVPSWTKFLTSIGAGNPRFTSSWVNFPRLDQVFLAVVQDHGRAALDQRADVVVFGRHLRVPWATVVGFDGRRAPPPRPSITRRRISGPS